MREVLEICAIALKVSVIAQIFAIGLASTWGHATYLFRRPGLLGRSILSRNVAAPMLAIVMVKIFPMHPAAAITLAVLSVTPVPPLLPAAHLREGGSLDYPVGLLVAHSVLGVVTVPATVVFMDWVFEGHARFSAARVAVLMLQTILAPLFAGMLASRFVPHPARVIRLLLAIGSAVLIAAAIPMLFPLQGAFRALVGNGTLLALALFIVVGTAIGHFLGGPVEANRTTLAIATASRHPAVALGIAATNFPTQRRLIAAAVVLYLLLRMLLNVPYLRWRRKALTAAEREEEGVQVV